MVSAGSLNTPCVLQRSRLRNPHIGRHLRLHPVTGITAKFFDKPVRSYEYAPMTTVRVCSLMLCIVRTTRSPRCTLT